MQAGGIVFLTSVIIGEAHRCHVEYEIADLTVELVLIDVPLCPISPGNIGISVDESNAGEIGTAFDGWSIGGVSYELRIIISGGVPVSGEDLRGRVPENTLKG